MKKLFKVSIELEMVVLGENEDDAERVALAKLPHADGERNEACTFASEVRSLAALKEPDALPWSTGPNELTCRELLEAAMAAKLAPLRRITAEERAANFGCTEPMFEKEGASCGEPATYIRTDWEFDDWGGEAWCDEHKPNDAATSHGRGAS